MKAVKNGGITDISDFCEKEFLDIMCNPWGYCILRYDQLHTAKCAESGIPSRHNACPSLCLGCINNLAGVGNIESLILLVSNHAAILSNSESDFPLSLKFNSFNTIKLAIVHLETLGAEEDLIDSYKLLLQSNSTFIY